MQDGLLSSETSCSTDPRFRINLASPHTAETGKEDLPKLDEGYLMEMEVQMKAQMEAPEKREAEAARRKAAIGEMKAKCEAMTAKRKGTRMTEKVK